MVDMLEFSRGRFSYFRTQKTLQDIVLTEGEEGLVVLQSRPSEGVRSEKEKLHG
jgi:hypothetical protein